MPSPPSSAVTPKPPAPRSSSAAVSSLDNWTFDNCSFDAKVDVAAVDWAFGGIPLELTEGSAAFRVTNIGDEMHEMGILRKVDGVTLSWDEIVPIVAESFLNETDEADQYVEWVGHAWVPTSENAAVAYADLPPGDYAAFCMLPIGTTQDMAEEDMEALAGPDHEAHWQHGMLQEFTVVAADLAVTTPRRRDHESHTAASSDSVRRTRTQQAVAGGTRRCPLGIWARARPRHGAPAHLA